MSEDRVFGSKPSIAAAILAALISIVAARLTSGTGDLAGGSNPTPQSSTQLAPAAK